jgi:hypothetical protein
MELKTAIEILEYHQEWRLGKREDMIHTPKKLTEAIDIILSEVKKLPTPTNINRISPEEIKEYRKQGRLSGATKDERFYKVIAKFFEQNYDDTDFTILYDC